MHNWKNVVISPDSSIEMAIKKIDEQGERIVLVVAGEDEFQLLGTITDGDIRRGLLRGISLKDPCNVIMNKSPIYTSPNSSKVQRRAIFDKHQIIHLPLVDDSGTLFGLETLQEHIHIEDKLENPVFLMAGGFGTRLKPLTNICPKPMLLIGDKPMLQLIIERFIKSGFHRFYISTHYMPEIIRDYFGDGSNWDISITYIHEEEPLGTGGALGLLPAHEINLPLIMMNGDLLTNVNFVELIDFHRTSDSVATMCVRDYEHQIPFGVIETDGKNVLSMIEKPTQKFKVNAGIYVLEPSLISTVSLGEKIDMPTLLNKEMENGQLIATFPIHEYWLDIGRREDFKRAQLEVGEVF